MPDINVTAKLKGPFFRANIDGWMDVVTDEAKHDVAQEAVDLVHIQLDHVLQNPTGYYDSQVQAEKVGKDWHVNDNGVIHGGWLEGVSERNASTRFKGYHTFRLVLQDIRRVGIDIAQHTFNRFIGRLN